MPALAFENVRKTFRVRDRGDALRDAIPRAFARLTGHAVIRRDPFVALDGVSFAVARGEALGLVGSNGSGKSTALRVAAGIYPADSGTVRVQGRVSSLIELAAGFHPDLSGRENIYLAGALLGLRRADVQSIFDRVVEFAGIGEFLDSPARTYSWGMSLRLGFAVAAHVPADVLLIDEVLAVGDAAFRARCLQRMSERRTEGAALVFVSHDLPMVERFCDRVIVLQHGRVVGDGPPRVTISDYRAAVLGSAPTAAARSSMPQLRRGTGEVRLHTVEMRSDAELPPGTALAGGPLRIRLEWESDTPQPGLLFGIALHSLEGALLAELQSPLDDSLGCGVQRAGAATVEISRLPLLPGAYEVSAYVRDLTSSVDLDHHQALYCLSVVGEDRAGSSGCIELDGRWSSFARDGALAGHLPSRSIAVSGPVTGSSR